MRKNKLPMFDTPGLQLFIFLIIVLVSLLFVSLAGIVFAIPFFGSNIITELGKLGSDDADLGLMKYFQVVNQMGLFIVPVVLFGYFVMKSNVKFYKLNMAPDINNFVLVFVLAFSILPIIGFLAEWNDGLQLPEMFSSVEEWMRQSEEKARKITVELLGETSLSGLSINMLMIAIIPAFGEELFFRGVLQQLFEKLFKNSHIAIIVTAFLFSALHMQFFGFIPRFLLGALFGYLFLWSKSMWIPIFAHFVNNGTAVVFSFLAASNTIAIKEEEIGDFNNTTGMIVFSLLLSVSILYYLYNKRVTYNTN